MEAEAYQIPRVDELIIDRLGKARFISTLILTKSYRQMPVAAKDRYKTAFVTPGVQSNAIWSQWSSCITPETNRPTYKRLPEVRCCLFG